MGTKRVVAIVQDEVASDVWSGLERTAELAREAAHSGAELVVFPDLDPWLPGLVRCVSRCCAVGSCTSEGSVRHDRRKQYLGPRKRL